MSMVVKKTMYFVFSNIHIFMYILKMYKVRLYSLVANGQTLGIFQNVYLLIKESDMSEAEKIDEQNYINKMVSKLRLP